MEMKAVTMAMVMDGTNSCVVLQEGAQLSYSLCSAQMVQWSPRGRGFHSRSQRGEAWRV